VIGFSTFKKTESLKSLALPSFSFLIGEGPYMLTYLLKETTSVGGLKVFAANTLLFLGELITLYG
jgi:hypothetical protein